MKKLAGFFAVQIILILFFIFVSTPSISEEKATKKECVSMCIKTVKMIEK